MPRVAALPTAQWDPELRTMAGADDATPLEQGPLRIMAHAPDITKPFLAFAVSLVMQSTLPRRLLELVRLRIAFHNQCRSCMAIRYSSAVDDGLTEGMVCSLEKPSEAPDLNDAEKAALAYADISATDHFSINDATYDNLRPYFNEKQIVELGMFIAYCIGFGRLSAGWNLVDELPDDYRGEGGDILSPWNRESVVVKG